MFRTVAQAVEAEIVEKKSKFIANVFEVQTEEEAQRSIEAIRKKHYQAKHHCYAYRVVSQQETNSFSIIEKMSDDGEPSGTAGAPLLNILRKQELANVIVIVTRYFGGILLGTGGLVRAYSEACKRAMEMAEIVEEQLGREMRITIPYGSLETLKYICQKRGVVITHIEYGNEVEVSCEVTEEEQMELKKMDIQIQIKKIEMLGRKYIRKTRKMDSV